MKAPSAIVTDHAVLRYLERAHGIPVELIREAMAASAAIGVRHQAPVVVLDNVKFVIVDGRVVTVLKRTWRMHQSRASKVKGPARP